MESWLKLMMTLLTLIATGAVGAFFATAKFKRERLWSERYQRLGDALVRVNLMRRYFESEVMGDSGMHGLTSSEKRELEMRWPTARYELTREITMLQMLFTRRDFEPASRAWHDLESSIWELLEVASDHDAHTYCSKSSLRTRVLEEELIRLSRKKCLGLVEKTCELLRRKSPSSTG